MDLGKGSRKPYESHRGLGGNYLSTAPDNACQKGGRAMLSKPAHAHETYARGPSGLVLLFSYGSQGQIALSSRQAVKLSRALE